MRVVPTLPTSGRDALPTIALVTPSFQQGRFIESTIQSVLNQSYPRLRYHVQDGGSSDETAEILARYANWLTWEASRDAGQASAINLGFGRVDGDIMGYINSDDLLLPGALLFAGGFFRDHPDVDVIYGDRLIIDENGGEIGCWRLPRHRDDVLSWADFVPQETLFWRRSAWERAGGRMDESFSFALDWDLIVRLRDTGSRFAHVPRFIGAFRVHDSQKTSALINEVGFAEMQRIRLRTLGREPNQGQIRRALVPYLAAHLLTDLAARIRDRASPPLRGITVRPPAM
jgi:glycosyltransferase involved in cell wall biosynthesis